MEHIHQNIDGWFDFEDLYRFVVRNLQEGEIVEVGSWLGKSASFMAVEICNSNKNIKFNCVDTWKGSEEHSGDSLVVNDQIYSKFLSNVDPVIKYINPIRKTSLEAAAEFKDNSLDFVFIDAGHSYEDVRDDINAWYPKVKEGGYIGGHDHSETWPGVIAAVKEFSEQKSTIVSLVEKSCWITKKQYKSNKVQVMSSHYAERLSWINFVKYPVQVYSKTLQNHNFINFNKVQEAPAYLKYIINNYSSLPDYSIFVHGHFTSEHQDKDIVEKINSIKFEELMINLNRPDWTCTIKKGEELEDRKFSWIENNWKDMVGDYLPLPDELHFPACAQFAVHKSLITRHPLEFYQKLFKWCEDTNVENYISSRVFEYIWYYIFSGKNIFKT